MELDDDDDDDGKMEEGLNGKTGDRERKYSEV